LCGDDVLTTLLSGGEISWSVGFAVVSVAAVDVGAGFEVGATVATAVVATVVVGASCVVLVVDVFADATAMGTSGALVA
jgi:hypothetical protein